MIQCEFLSKTIQPLNPEIGFSMNFIQKWIQPLNPQI